MTLRDFIQQNATVFGSLPFVVISSVDSHTKDVGEMPWSQERISKNPAWAHSVSPLVIRGSDLVQLAHDGLFNGFDEIWIPSQLPVAPNPEDAHLVAPLQFDQSIPDEVANWMRDSGSRLGLGDGYGLNFISSDAELSTQLGLSATYKEESRGFGESD